MPAHKKSDDQRAREAALKWLRLASAAKLAADLRAKEASHMCDKAERDLWTAVEARKSAATEQANAFRECGLRGVTCDEILREFGVTD